MLGRCFKFINNDVTTFIKLVSIDTVANTFTGLAITVPNNTGTEPENDEVLETNKYGPYVVGDTLPYSNISITFISDLDADKANDNSVNEISADEFSTALSTVMDTLLRIGY